ncbi:MAG TPA: hypothetical protein PLV22_06060 [Candidatus Cloacimonadota bacterium]|nr:hypothetical protein [Candidatus Cloacimonadota bacterium]
MEDKERTELEKWAKYGKLMSGFIHNLNTPLMGLSGRIELMEIKYPDIKELGSLIKHIDSLSDMLKASAYFIDKDTNDKTYDTNIEDFINRFDLFMKSHMQYKHNLFVEKELQEVIKPVNSQRYFNALYQIVIFVLSYASVEDTLTYKNDSEKISLTFNRGDDKTYSIDAKVLEDIKNEVKSNSKEMDMNFDITVAPERIEVVLNI